MKHIFPIAVLAILLSLSCKAFANDTYEIYSADDLLEFADLMWENPSLNAELMQDIDMDGIEMEPIGGGFMDRGDGLEYWKKGYEGVFDGNGHTISNMTIDVKYWLGGGLFYEIAQGGVVKNLKLVNFHIFSDIYTIRTGAIATQNYGIISSCNAQGSMNIKDCSKVGGIVAETWQTIANCVSEMDITCKITDEGYKSFGSCSVSGIAPSVYGIVNNCTNLGNIKLSGKIPSCSINVAGVASFPGDSMVNCGNQGNIIVDAVGVSDLSGDVMLGGIFNYAFDKNAVRNCYNTGDITGTIKNSTVNFGGIHAFPPYYVCADNCYSTGEINVEVDYEDPKTVNFTNDSSYSLYYQGDASAKGGHRGQYFTKEDYFSTTLLEKLNDYVKKSNDENLFYWEKSGDTIIPVGFASSLLFEDVQASSYYYDSVVWATEEKITSGTSKTTFSPDAPCTQGQILTFIWRAAGEYDPESYNSYYTNSNVTPDKYYYAPMQWAFEEGLVDYSDLNPEDICYREDVVWYLWCLEGCPVSENEVEFTDIEYEFLEEAVSWAVENNITSGISKDKFGFSQPCTRGQIVTFLHRYFNAK